MPELLIATRNRGKLREYQEILEGLPLRLLTLDDVGLGSMDVEETGASFEENAHLKADAYAAAAKRLTLADDSGLCVDALDGAPGVYSARYAGEGATDADRRAKLLAALAHVPATERQAHFVCVTVLQNPADDSRHATRGECHGQIAFAASNGQFGFGYDPVFIPDGYSVTLAEIPPQQKNALSHRGRALVQLRPVLERLLQEGTNR